eukprot:394295-Amphidinium_carterae.1
MCGGARHGSRARRQLEHCDWDRPSASRGLPHLHIRMIEDGTLTTSGLSQHVRMSKQLQEPLRPPGRSGALAVSSTECVFRTRCRWQPTVPAGAPAAAKPAAPTVPSRIYEDNPSRLKTALKLCGLVI